MNEVVGPELQRDVQRLLGRCLLRLQQYERLMKLILSHAHLAGPVDELEVQRAARIEKYADKSLGTLVKALFETYVVAPGEDEEVLDDSKVPSDRISMGFRMRLEMEEERRLGVKAAIGELVEMRNELVHHLIEQHDLWTEAGCAAAIEHLHRCYERIDRHFAELRQWAEAMEQSRALAASFMQSDVYLDLVLNGIAPDGSVDWAAAGIVRVLREASQALALEGWTRLDDARAWIAERHPEQVPAKYGCRSRQHVLSESRSFVLEYRLEDGRRVARYRTRS